MSTRIWIVMLMGISCIVPRVSAQTDEDEKKNESELRLKRLTHCAKSLVIPEVDRGEKLAAELGEKPVLRWDDAARNHPDGTLWIWKSRGRPVAIMEIYQRGFQDFRISHCGHSLSAKPVSLNRVESALFPAEAPGVQYQELRDGPKPSENKVGRMRQVKELARRFTAHQFWLPGNTRYDLRLLTQPVHRYEAPELGVLDGNVFIFAHGTNPEAVLLLELIKDESSETKWQFALARIGHAGFHVHLDEQEVWTVPRADRVPPSTAYWAFVRNPPNVEK